MDGHYLTTGTNMEIKQIIVTTTLMLWMHGLFIHTIRTEAKAVVVEQGGGVQTLQKFGENRIQQNKSV